MVYMDRTLNQNTQNAAWSQLVTNFELTGYQKDQFELYLEQLVLWNKKFNITALTSTQDVLEYHFIDSLHVASIVDFTTVRALADVGTGGGFPGIPLKIKYPHLKLFLIEVNTKKIDFLKHVCNALGLEHVTFCSQDWRTFLRSTEYPIDLFVARASLQPEELVRIFKPSCSYQSASLIYMASSQYKPSMKVSGYVKESKTYTVGDRERQLILLKG